MYYWAFDFKCYKNNITTTRTIWPFQGVSRFSNKFSSTTFMKSGGVACLNEGIKKSGEGIYHRCFHAFRIWKWANCRLLAPLRFSEFFMELQKKNVGLCEKFIFVIVGHQLELFHMINRSDYNVNVNLINFYNDITKKNNSHAKRPSKSWRNGLQIRIMLVC